MIGWNIAWRWPWQATSQLTFSNSVAKLIPPFDHYRNRKSLRIIEFHDLPPGISPRTCPCSAQMTRRVNLRDSYWCTVLNGFTVGATQKIHSDCFCCWEPPELKLIKGDSDEIGRGVGEIWWPLLEANRPYDSHSSHIDVSLHSCSLIYVYSIDARIIVKGSLLPSECEYSVSPDSALHPNFSGFH